jgi:hypothetical protein
MFDRHEYSSPWQRSVPVEIISGSAPAALSSQAQEELSLSDPYSDDQDA